MILNYTHSGADTRYIGVGYVKTAWSGVIEAPVDPGIITELLTITFGKPVEPFKIKIGKPVEPLKITFGTPVEPLKIRFRG